MTDLCDARERAFMRASHACRSVLSHPGLNPAVARLVTLQSRTRPLPTLSDKALATVLPAFDGHRLGVAA